MGIAVQKLTKVYGEQKAIDAISFDIEAGQIVGFLGPNGAGKTTTMKIITCFLPPTSGSVTVDGLDIAKDALAIRRKIGYLPEHNPLYLEMYVHEYLRYVGRLYQLPGKGLQERVDAVIAMTGLGREQHKKIGALSKGYRQRVGLSQALIHDPDILILDEPTTGLDPNQIVDIRSLIKDIGKEKTIIFSTHILSEVEAIADRVIIIDRGKIVADEGIQSLRAHTEGLVLRIAFEREGFDFEALAKVHPGLEVQPSGPREFTLSMPPGVDPRTALFQQSIATDNPIALLEKGQRNLEEIFRTLTKTAQ